MHIPLPIHFLRIWQVPMKKSSHLLFLNAFTRNTHKEGIFFHPFRKNKNIVTIQRDVSNISRV